MPGSMWWFIMILGVLPLAWLAGQRSAAIQDPWRRGCVIGAVVFLLMGWAAMIRNPTVALELIPISVLARLEGVGAAPLFVFIVAVGWRLAVLRRQRAVMIVAMLLGSAYVVQGGFWMTQPTPANAFGHGNDQRIYVRQTQDYSCVPAASATALRILGIHASEAEMAKLTETRPGTGATLLRALNGLQTRLAETGIKPSLIELDYEQLMRIEPPMLTALRFERGQLHMVTIVEVRPNRVVVADPEAGIEFVPRQVFLDHYRGKAIAFDGGGLRATTRDLLDQMPLVRDPDATAPGPFDEPLEHAAFVTSTDDRP